MHVAKWIFRKRLVTRDETQIFPCKNIKFTYLDRGFKRLFQFSSHIWELKIKQESKKRSMKLCDRKLGNEIAFIDRHDVLTICKFRFEAFSFPYVLCLTNNASYKETYGNA